jgi:Cu-Zn family superoxide dismutase
MSAAEGFRKRVIMASKITAISAASVLFLAACGKTGGAEPAAEPMLDPLAPAGWADATAGFAGVDGAEMGDVVFKDAPNGGVIMRVDLNGLTQGWHGIHLHQIGDCHDGHDGFKASAGHVDPEDREHGLLNPAGPEAADVTNIYAGADGRATAEIFNASAALGGADGLIDADGFAVVVHANPDDHMTQPIGGAGARVACAAVTAN